MKVSFVIHVALCVFFASIIAMADPTEAPVLSKRNYDASMNNFLQRYFFPNKPGAAVLVMKNGEVLLNRAYGLANVEVSAPVKTDTVFHIASVGK